MWFGGTGRAGRQSHRTGRRTWVAVSKKWWLVEEVEEVVAKERTNNSHCAT
jgi:hypothetical protein